MLKKFISLIILPLFFTLSGFSQNVEKVFVKSFNPGDASTVALDIPADVEIKRWSNKIIRAQLTVQLENATDSKLHALVQTGRYLLFGKNDAGVYRIVAPGLKKETTVSGRAFTEQLSLVLYLPENLTLETLNAAKEGVSVGSE